MARYSRSRSGRRASKVKSIAYCWSTECYSLSKPEGKVDVSSRARVSQAERAASPFLRLQVARSGAIALCIQNGRGHIVLQTDVLGRKEYLLGRGNNGRRALMGGRVLYV